MAVYFQHVGEAGGKRDFPKTIGTATSGLKLFQIEEIEKYIDNAAPGEIDAIRRELNSVTPNGFQIWGIPSGAKSVLRALSNGDFLLLLETTKGGGSFYYAGEVVAFLSRENFRLSMHLWGEARFPLIVFLRGGLADYSWEKFCNEFGHKTNRNPAGQTIRLKSEKIAISPFPSERDIVVRMTGLDFSTMKYSPLLDDLISDVAELDISDREALKSLREHMVRERSSKLIRAFKKSLVKFECVACGFDFQRFYGELGRNFIEAHHQKPIAMMAEGGETRLSDLVPLCSNCHRMVHRHLPIITVDELKHEIEKQIAERSGLRPF